MVKVGDFTLELVDAETKTPFKEHVAPNGRTYVETEPDAEYFLLVASDHSKPVKVYAEVDGEKFDYHKIFYSGGARGFMGLWNVSCGESSMVALKMERTRSSAGSTAPGLWTGEVKADFFESVRTDEFYETDLHDDRTCPWNSAGIVGFLKGDDTFHKKGIKSIVGQSALEDSAKRNTRKYKTGEKLCSIEISYCTALGLIHAGILPKPPFWEFCRTAYPRKKDESAPSVTPERIKVSAETASDGTVLKEAREYDYFDFTTYSSDDDEGSVSIVPVTKEELVPDVMEGIVGGKSFRVRVQYSSDDDEASTSNVAVSSEELVPDQMEGIVGGTSVQVRVKVT